MVPAGAHKPESVHVRRQPGDESLERGHASRITALSNDENQSGGSQKDRKANQPNVLKKEIADVDAAPRVTCQTVGANQPSRTPQAAKAKATIAPNPAARRLYTAIPPSVWVGRGSDIGF